MRPCNTGMLESLSVVAGYLSCNLVGGSKAVHAMTNIFLRLLILFLKPVLFVNLFFF